jgi:hypothetical protein
MVMFAAKRLHLDEAGKLGQSKAHNRLLCLHSYMVWVIVKE